MARTFNPLDREPSFLELGDRTFEVREATRGVMRRVSEYQQRLENIDEHDSDAAVRVFAEIVGAAVKDGEEAADRILMLWDRDELSISALVRIVQFIGEELQGDASLGEA